MRRGEGEMRSALCGWGGGDAECFVWVEVCFSLVLFTQAEVFCLICAV